MGKLFWQINMSLDGFMEESDGNLKRTAEIDDPDYQKYATEMLGTITGFIIGRKTYELFAGYWPTATGPDAEMLNHLPKLVFSRSLKATDWNNSRIAHGDAASEIGRFQAECGGDVALFGSSELAGSVMELNLIDEYRIIVTPFILGGGKSAFTKDRTATLKLERSETWSSGTVALKYSRVENSGGN
jgi:dihydrofolate reductase